MRASSRLFASPRFINVDDERGVRGHFPFSLSPFGREDTMAFDAAKFSGSIPDYYNRAMVPIMFTDCAQDMAQRVAAAKPAHVLELAAGTGVVTQALRSLLPA